MAGLMMTHMTTRTDALFRERRGVPLWWWFVAVVVAVPSVEVVAVYAPDMESHGGWLLAVGVGIATVAVIAALLIAISRSYVVVDVTGLRADRDFLPASTIGRVRTLDRATMRDLLGRDARADAVMSIKPWVVTGVQVEVADSADRTPYWVVASRRPTELATALRTLAPRADGDERVERSSGEDR
jgi:hypothetical protein